MYNEIIYLADEVPTGELDEYGDPIMKFVKSQVFAKKKSIGQTEFYQAQTSDYKPEIKFKIPDAGDYEEQKFLIYGDTIYKILRVFQSEDTNESEITCYGGVRNANTANSDENN